jgi:hypothetical protein
MGVVGGVLGGVDIVSMVWMIGIGVRNRWEEKWNLG